jgi:hypothetical protein
MALPPGPCEDPSVRPRPFFALSVGLGFGLTLPLACGGSAFQAGPSTADSGLLDSSSLLDSGSLDSPSGDSSAADTAAASDAPADTTPAEASVCAPLTAADVDIYVDSRFTGTPATGAQACPVHTILEGIAIANTLGGARTVHVAGTTPALVYDETGTVPVASGITLLGAGALMTTISAAGACMTGTCAVLVQPGAILDGFSVVSPTGDGVWTTAGNGAVPIVRNVAADSSMGNGIVALGSVQLGPNIVVNSNGAAGVESPAGSVGTVHVVAGINAFSNNKGNGIDLSGAAALNFEGGATNGDTQGIRIASQPSTSHSITALTAKNNTGPGGVVVYGGQTLKLRSSTLVGNTGYGLSYDYPSGNTLGSTLDIGTTADPGGNTFGGATSTDRNGLAGIQLCGVPAMQQAGGDSWSTCPPTQLSITCGTAPAMYVDVAYQSAVAAVDPVTGACTVGP